jgi:hypothetical protein
MKIKFMPIRLRWQNHRQSSSDGELEGKRVQKPNRGGYFGDSRWFRSPPKVHIVPGILGPPLVVLTCVSHLGVGEREVEEDNDFEHRPSDKGPSNPSSLDCCSSPNLIFRSRPHQTLARFMKHFWQGASLRSFAAVVSAEPAPVVRVAMQPRGGGRRGGFGPSHEGPGGGRQGRAFLTFCHFYGRHSLVCQL